METLSWATMILERRYNRLNPTPSYQRDSVWTRRQKQLLIDTIIRNMDIPKIYFRMLTTDPEYDYEIIDGQQRVRAIYEFRTNQFKLSDEYTPEYGEVPYNELPENVKDHIDMYALDIVVVEEATDTMIREMFLRLQNGTQLTQAEKRNAMGGAVHHFVEHLVQSYPVISSVRARQIRQYHQETAAQCVLLELQGEGATLTDKYIVEMYETYDSFNPRDAVAKKIRRTMAFLDAALGDDTPEVSTRAQFVSLYWLVAAVIDTFVLSGYEMTFHNFVVDFEQRCRDEADGDALARKYLTAMNNTPQQWSSINSRHDALLQAWLLYAPDLPTRDAQRHFTNLQRMVIYRRDKGICQICGEEVVYAAFEADHVVPHSQGGKTVVANGQTTHRLCNASKAMQRTG
ncbi:MAG: DUF262 domain-containing protein [Chloroflexota bacterium]